MSNSMVRVIKDRAEAVVASDRAFADFNERLLLGGLTVLPRFARKWWPLAFSEPTYERCVVCNLTIPSTEGGLCADHKYQPTEDMVWLENRNSAQMLKGQ